MWQSAAADDLEMCRAKWAGKPRQLPAEAPVVGQFITAPFEGLVLAWLADPDNTDVDAVLRLAHDLMKPSVPNTLDTSDVS